MILFPQNDSKISFHFLFAQKSSNMSIVISLRPRNPRGNNQRSAALLTNTQVYKARWDPPKGTEGAGGRADQDTFHHLPAALDEWEGPR